MGDVTEDTTEPYEQNHPAIECVKFTPAPTNKVYRCNKLTEIEAVLVANATTDDQEFQVSWAKNATNLTVDVTIEPEAAGDDDTGYLIVFGRK